jgi:hypothetical protein
MKHWTLEDIDWAAFDPTGVDPDILSIVKAAALVEANGADYATYLCGVFAGDQAFQRAARSWGDEEIQHGQALARWAMLADPAWDFTAASARFSAGYRVPLDRAESVRGSRAGELIARCIVETGTSSYYSALAEAAAEPVLRDICRRLAADEFRHYKLFYDHLREYQMAERMSAWTRLRIAVGRIAESSDDELAYAYFAANTAVEEKYSRRIWSQAYARRAYRLYAKHHVERGIAMIFKAAGLQPNGRLHRWAWPIAHLYLVRRARSLAASKA